MMSVQQVKPRHFGANNGPICAKCNRLKQIVRRSPHPLYGYAGNPAPLHAGHLDSVGFVRGFFI